jgi:hypothetical protein
MIELTIGLALWVGVGLAAAVAIGRASAIGTPRRATCRIHRPR